MPGNAKTNNFMLGSATVMIGDMTDLFELNPSQDSIGLVKNFTVSSEPQFVELTQGVKNTLVHSTLTANPIRASMEVYEFTAANLAYGLGLDGASYVLVPAETLIVTHTAATAIVTVTTSDGADYAVGDWVMIFADTEDNFIVRQIASKATDTLTLDRQITLSQAGKTLKKVASVGMGSKADQPYFSAKIAGKLADATPVVILLPKIRIVRGFSMAFTTDDYGNLPYEFSVYDLVTSDTYFDEFGGDSGRILRP